MYVNVKYLQRGSWVLLTLLVGSVGCEGADSLSADPNLYRNSGLALCSPSSNGGLETLPACEVFWTCETVPAGYTKEVSCTASVPHGMDMPPGGYSCSASSHNLECPPPTSGGTGSWNCQATEVLLQCHRPGSAPNDSPGSMPTTPPGSTTPGSTPGTTPTTPGTGPVVQPQPPTTPPTTPAPAPTTCENGQVTPSLPQSSVAPPTTCDLSAWRVYFCERWNEQFRLAGSQYEVDCTTFRAIVPAVTQANHLPSCTSIADSITFALHVQACTQCPDQIGPLAQEFSDAARDLRQETLAKGRCVTPIILDLDGDGIHLSSIDEGVQFDLLASGEPVQCAWPRGQDALLVLDRNGNGQVDSSAELFGDHSAGGTFADGYAAMSSLDDNGDGMLDAKDSRFAKLQLWIDSNRDGKTNRGELVSLAQAGITQIELTAQHDDLTLGMDLYGNLMPTFSHFTRRDGTKGLLTDAYLRFDHPIAPLEAEVATLTGPAVTR